MRSRRPASTVRRPIVAFPLSRPAAVAPAWGGGGAGRLRRRIRGAALLAVVAALGLAAACDGPAAQVVTTFRNEVLDPAKLSPSGTLAGGVADPARDIEYLGYNVTRVSLCQNATSVPYTYTETVDTPSGPVQVERSFESLEPDRASCATVFDKPTALDLSAAWDDPVGACPEMRAHPEEWENFAAADFASALPPAGLPLGTYRYAFIEVHPRVALQASVTVQDPEGTAATLYTKECGPATCGSRCDGSRMLSDCGGGLPELASTPAVGDVDPATGDSWTESPFAASEGPACTDGACRGYWRRCDHDLTAGPAERVIYRPNANDNIAVEFLAPLVVERAEDRYQVDLVFTLEGALTASAASMSYVGAEGVSSDYPTAGWYHSQPYGLTDGFHAIDLSPLALVPVAYRPEEKVWRYTYVAEVRGASAQPACYLDGFDVAPTLGGVEGPCHPCHGWEGECHNGLIVTNDRVFSTQEMVPSQDFDVRIDLYYVGTDAPDLTQVRAAGVTASFAAGRPVTGMVPFFPMVAHELRLNADGTLDLRQRTNGGAFPRIRGLPLLAAEGDRGQVVVETQFQPIVHDAPECATCGWECPAVACNATDLFYQVPVRLVAISERGGAGR